jgi:FkbM family methyltransferase
VLSARERAREPRAHETPDRADDRGEGQAQGDDGEDHAGPRVAARQIVEADPEQEQAPSEEAEEREQDRRASQRWSRPAGRACVRRCCVAGPGPGLALAGTAPRVSQSRNPAVGRQKPDRPDSPYEEPGARHATECRESLLLQCRSVGFDDREPPVDDPVLAELQRWLLEASDAAAADVLAGLIETLPTEAVGALMERMPPLRPLDYESHPIRLLMSSSEIGVRLRSAEKEPFTVDWIERFLEAGDVFYDIGANVGAYSLIAAKVTGNRARVFAFEPSPASFHDLVRNVAVNGCIGSVMTLPFAVWSETELLGIPSPAAPGAARHRLGNRLDTSAAVALGVRLDDLVERFGLPVPTHAKIDTDGYELEVLRGAEQTLLRPEWRSIIVELDKDETSRNRRIAKLLADAGFGVCRRHDRAPTPGFPRPEGRPDVYWTFERSHRRERQPARALRLARPRRTAIESARRRAVAATLAVVSFLFLLLVFLPEELGDRPYDVFGLRF